MDSQFILLAICLGIVLFSSTIQGVFGFGFALFAVPFLSIFFPLNISVPLVIMCSTITASIIFFSTFKYFKLNYMWLLIIFATIGIPFGVYLVIKIDQDIMKFCIGVLALIITIFMLKGFRLKLKNKNISYSVIGIITGILTSSTSMGGPSIVLFLSNENYDKDSFRAGFSGYAIAINIITIITYLISGNMNSEIIKLFGFSIPAVLCGSFFGVFLTRFIDERIFKNLIFLIIIILSLWVMFRSGLIILNNYYY